MHQRQSPKEADGFIVGISLNGGLTTDAGVAKARGWGAGTVVEGDEGFGPTRIVITAVGEHHILARKISHNGEKTEARETLWSLQLRDWKKVDEINIGSKD
jgi:hypothetical protein